MPLSAADMQFLNCLLDRHLKNQRSWPWIRCVELLMAAFLIALGIWQFSLPGYIAHSFASEASIASQTTTSPDAAFTRPVSYRELLQAEDSMATRAAAEAWVPALAVECYLVGALGI
jgi:hypothetical protein